MQASRATGAASGSAAPCPTRSTTPRKPSTKPTVLRAVIRSPGTSACASGSTSSGTTAMVMPAKPELTCRCPQASSEKGRAFDAEPLLVRLEWRHRHETVHAVEGSLALRESAFDPVADLPVRRLVRMEYEEGRTQSNGSVLRTLPAEWVLPFLHGRYDEMGVAGIEIG